MTPQDSQKVVSNEDVKNIVLERLKILSPDTVISIGSSENVSRDQLIQHVKDEDSVGELFAEMQMEWIRSFKEKV